MIRRDLARIQECWHIHAQLSQIKQLTMSWTPTIKSFDLGDGRSITLETGRLARQADGSILLRMGKAALLCTVVSAHEPRENASFFPLSVDYQEKFFSNGRIPGSFQRREGRLNDDEILISRLVDRALRPLFPDDYYNDTQVIINIFSFDPEVKTDALAGLAASAALSVSDIPFAGPIAECRVARIDGEFIVNPRTSDLERADLEVIVGATEKDVTMVEGEADQCSEEDLVEAIKVGHEAIKRMCQLQNEMAAEIGKPKREIVAFQENEEMLAKVEDFASDRILEIARGALPKHVRKERLSEVKADFMETLGEEPDADDVAFAKRYLKKVEKKVIRNMILDEQIRLDGRRLDEVRPLHIEVDLFDSPHGCSLFSRGETQAIASVTMGVKSDAQLIDRPTGVTFNKFMLHYTFPPYCTGEVKPIRGVSRREVGHGNLAMRSLKQVMPSEEDNPYTIRVTSDVLESNGSSSMATVCSGSLALMDAGIPIKGAVSGIAMGMISDGSRVAVLTDILGDEDHLGDMDFKVTGTAEGICAVQMDIKVDGLPYEVLRAALQQANRGRLHILEQMNEVIDAPRTEPKSHAPRIERLVVPLEYVGMIIGPGGKHIQELQRETETNINIEEIDSKTAEVLVYSNDADNMKKCVDYLRLLTSEPEIGEVYEGTVTSIKEFGAFVEILPKKEGLLHISEISWSRLPSMEGIFEPGDKVKVKLLNIENGKFKLSRKVLLEKPEGYVERPPRPPRDRNDRRGGGRRDDRRGGGRYDDRNRR